MGYKRHTSEGLTRFALGVKADVIGFLPRLRDNPKRLVTGTVFGVTFIILLNIKFTSTKQRT